MLPTAGLIDHWALTFPPVFTLAENCCAWEADNETWAGLTLSDEGAVAVSEIITVAVFVGSAWLVAMSAIVWPALIVAGAV
jgi:hypothetical protein